MEFDWSMLGDEEVLIDILHSVLEEPDLTGGYEEGEESEYFIEKALKYYDLGLVMALVDEAERRHLRFLKFSGDV